MSTHAADSDATIGEISEEAEWVEQPNHVSLLIGNTRDEGEDSFTVGLDYERRRSDLLGLGGLVEHSGGHLDATLAAFSVYFHPWRGWILEAAPGIERRDGKYNALLRLGVKYEFEIRRITIMPEIDADMVEGNIATTFGVSIGMKF